LNFECIIAQLILN